MKIFLFKKRGKKGFLSDFMKIFLAIVFLILMLIGVYYILNNLI